MNSNKEQKDNTFNPIDFYDVVINIESLRMFKNGYEIEFSQRGYDHYQNKKNDKCCAVGVVGNKNKGKTYLLEKLSGVVLPKGHTVTTKGVSVVYPQTEKNTAGVVLIDTAGLETPLLRNEVEEEDMSLIARDKQLTELFLQKFVISNSNVLIAVVGALTLADQKLLHRIVNEWKMGKTSKLLVVHNLMNHETMQQVGEYIEDILLQSFTFKLEKTETVSLPCLIPKQSTEQNEKTVHTIYQQKVMNHHNEEQTIIHLLLGREGTEAGNTLNVKTLEYLQMQIATNQNNAEFPLVEKMKKFLSLKSKDLFEEPKVEEDEIDIKDDKVIRLKNPQEIVLKKCLVDELGVSSLYSNTFSPKCCCYIDGNFLIFELEISEKVNGLKSEVKSQNDMNYFVIKGTKEVENEKLLQGKQILQKSVDSGPFQFEISIPIEVVQLSSTKSTVTRKGNNSKTNNILISFPIQEKSEEVTVDI